MEKKRKKRPRSFDDFCNEPAFPVPLAGASKTGMLQGMITVHYEHSKLKGLTKFEWFVSQMVVSNPLGIAAVGLFREQQMKQRIYFAEDMLYTIWKHKGGVL